MIDFILAPYTDIEQKAIKCLSDYQHNYKPIDDELCPEVFILLNKSGDLIERKTVSSIGGCLTEKMTKAIENEPCIFIHNHPSNHSLGQDDWNALSNNLKLEMVAVNSNGSTFRGKVIEPFAFIDWLQMMSDVYHNVEYEFESYLRTELRHNNADFIMKVRSLIGIHIGITLHEKRYVIYEYDLQGEDLKQWEATDSQVPQMHNKLSELTKKYIQ